MFTQTAEYALRAVVYLATHEDEPVTTHQIARATQVPGDYLSKVLQALARGGLVSAQRGKNGGFVLSKHPGRITILDVINLVDPVPRIRRCPLGLKAHGTRLCSLHRKLDDAMDSIERILQSSTIAALLEDSSPSKPLCQITGVVHA